MNKLNFYRQTQKSLLLMVSLACVSAFSAILDIQPSVQEVHTGNQFTLDIGISGLEENEQIGGYDFDLFFDPSIFSFSGYKLSDNLGSLTNSQALDFSAGLTGSGKVNLSSISLIDNLSFQPGAFSLASVTFNAIGEGSGEFSLPNVLLSDFFGEEITAEIKSASVSSVPEASAMPLFCAGFLMLLSIGAIKRKVC